MSSEIVSYQKAEIQASFCRIFSNAYRIMILWALDGREMSVGNLAEIIRSTQQNTSQHLRLMKARGFVQSRKEGSKVLYSLTPKLISNDCGLLAINNKSKDNNP